MDKGDVGRLSVNTYGLRHSKQITCLKISTLKFKCGSNQSGTCKGAILMCLLSVFIGTISNIDVFIISVYWNNQHQQLANLLVVIQILNYLVALFIILLHGIYKS